MPSLDSFHGPLKALLEATTYELALTTQHMNELASLYGIRVEDQSVEDLRAEFNQRVAGLLLSGSISWWKARKDVARVLVKRDGSTIIFARSQPRLTKAEVRYLKDELLFCGFSEAKVIAIWRD